MVLGSKYLPEVYMADPLGQLYVVVVGRVKFVVGKCRHPEGPFVLLLWN